MCKNTRVKDMPQRPWKDVEEVPDTKECGYFGRPSVNLQLVASKPNSPPTFKAGIIRGFCMRKRKDVSAIAVKFFAKVFYLHLF